MAARAEPAVRTQGVRPNGGRDRTAAPARSAVLRGATRLVETTLGSVLVTVNDTTPGEPAEVFVRAGKAGSDLAGFAEAIGRLCSLCLRLPSPTPGAARSLPDAVARALADAVGAETRPDADPGTAADVAR